jgi:hypothetical protein
MAKEGVTPTKTDAQPTQASHDDRSALTNKDAHVTQPEGIDTNNYTRKGKYIYNTEKALDVS